MFRYFFLACFFSLSLLLSFHTKANNTFDTAHSGGICLMGAAGTAPIANQQLVQTKDLIYASSRPEMDSLELAKTKRKAKWSKFLGIGSLVGLLIPGINSLSLPAAIAAIITGNNAKRDATDGQVRKDASTGITTGWITVGLFIVAALVAVVVIAVVLRGWN